MDSSSQGVALDSSKCSKLSMEEKRELVYQLSKWSNGASEVLQSWSRQEILDILCVEMGKERKYTNLTKLKIIEHLLKVVSEKKSGGHEAVVELESHSSLTLGQRNAKRQRKIENPSRLPVSASLVAFNNGGIESSNTLYCKNSACKAILSREDAFCRRCSCCICYKYDDNKDPSLWLTCSSDPPFLGDSCGHSCHLECALKHEGSGIVEDGKHPKLDGSFYCVSCGKVNDLLRCLRKQLMIAKDSRRVDILCYRVSLSQKLLHETDKYQMLQNIVDEAVKKLELEVGPLTGSPVKIGRGIVNRLSSGPEVQKLCASAVESLNPIISKMISHISPSSTVQDLNLVSPNLVRFEDVSSTSLSVILGSEDPSAKSSVGYRLWHRMIHDVNYQAEPTCTLFTPDARFTIRGLRPATEYSFKVVPFNDLMKLGTCEVHISTENSEDKVPNCSFVDRTQSPATNCSSLSNPSSVEDETNNSNPYTDPTDKPGENYPTFCKDTKKLVTTRSSNDAINCISTYLATSADADSLSEKEHSMKIVSSSPCSDALKLENKSSPEDQIVEDVSTDNGSNSPARTGQECVPFVDSSEAGLLVTPCKVETLKNGSGRGEKSKSSGMDQRNGTVRGERPQDGERQDENCAGNGLSDRNVEYYVKVIRWLECEGHIEKNFRQKFLTWYTLRATPQEVRVVKVYVDTFLEDPASLAEQLVDTFSGCISSKRTSVVPAGFCLKLWH